MINSPVIDALVKGSPNFVIHADCDDNKCEFEELTRVCIHHKDNRGDLVPHDPEECGTCIHLCALNRPMLMLVTPDQVCDEPPKPLYAPAPKNDIGSGRGPSKTQTNIGEY